MGVRYCPEVSLGVVVKDTVVNLTGVSTYWRLIFLDTSSTTTPALHSCQLKITTIETVSMRVIFLDTSSTTTPVLHGCQ